MASFEDKTINEIAIMMGYEPEVFEQKKARLFPVTGKKDSCER